MTESEPCWALNRRAYAKTRKNQAAGTRQAALYAAAMSFSCAKPTDTFHCWFQLNSQASHQCASEQRYQYPVGPVHLATRAKDLDALPGSPAMSPQAPEALQTSAYEATDLDLALSFNCTVLQDVTILQAPRETLPSDS